MFSENIRTMLEKNRARYMRMLTLAATLFFAGAVFKITANKWPEGVIYFAAAAFFVSLERAYSRKYKKTDDHGEASAAGQEESGDNGNN